MFQISEVPEAPAFNGRRSFLTLRSQPAGRVQADTEVKTRAGVE
jgi:hypothetical protein